MTHADLDVDGVLGRGGALEGALRGYEHRAAQLELARAIQKALSEGTSLLAEAGTGVGKTLAYLVPAVLSGRRVVISTATKTLQEQLITKDIPLLRDRVGLDFSAAVLKGRSNYLCTLRYSAFDQQPLFRSPEDAAHWPAFRDWAASTQTGERSETHVPDGWATWSALSTTSETCAGGSCPHLETCYVTKARREAADCQLIIVNHALFFADLSLRARRGPLELAVLPPYDAVVFDEAHALEDAATEHFGHTVSVHRLQALAHDALEALPALDPRQGMLTALSLTLRTRAEGLFSAVGSALREGSDVPLSPPILEALRPKAAAVQETLAALAALCPEDDVDVGPLHRRATETGEALAVVLDAPNASRAAWLESHGRALTLRSSPIDVGPLLRKHLYSQVKSVVFTSATLATAGGSFAYVAERLGLVGGPFETVRAGSPFDYQRQAVLYLPRGLPEPSSPGWTEAFSEEVVRLTELTHGRAFVLFTSLRHLDEVWARVAPRLTVPALKQGAAPRRALLEAFHRAPSVLFAAQSFWEGVDVPGEALSLVIIDRLPFSPPGAPLTAARIEAVRARGDEPFSSLQLPEAALALRQGFGRLIRTQTDFGIVALGDARVRTRRYGQVFLDSLPPAKPLEDFDEVARWWHARLEEP